MTTVIIIFALSCISMIALVLLKPSVIIHGKAVNIYWAAPLIGALLMMIFGCISPGEVFSGLTADTEINPIKILILFFSMTFISIYLDEAGFFRMAASLVLKKASSSQKMLFILLYITVSVLTMFTSNDIIVLTFTPFICYFAKNADIDPIPYLFCEFIAANTWSMALIIGNPTNIYLATGAGISFIEYTAVMLLPTALAGIASFGTLWLLFSKKLSKPMSRSSASEKLSNKPAAILAGIHLSLCIIALVLSSYINAPMWIISLIFALSLIICTIIMNIIRKKGSRVIFVSLIRIPFELIPFIISMFVLVLSLEKTGALATVASLISGNGAIIKFGIASLIMANIVNNIPMSVMFSSITAAISGTAEYTGALYASVIGSNIGAFLTPIGALAGIMWIGLLRSRGINMSFGKFTKYGSVIAVFSLAAALLGLYIVI